MNHWNDLVAFLDGRKTYILAAAGIIYAAGIQFWGWPSNGDVWAALGFGTAATLRVAIAKAVALLPADTTPTGPAPNPPAAPPVK